MKKAIGVILCFSLFLTLWAERVQAAESVRIHYTVTTQQTTIVIEWDKPVRYHAFDLKNPPRFVIDFESTHWKWPAVILPPHSVVRTIRHGGQRLVFDMRYPTTVSVKLQQGRYPQARLTLIFRQHDHLSPVPAFSSSASLSDIPITPHGRDIVVVIDPGHGGKDPGAMGRKGRCEKDIVLSIAKELQEVINQQPGFTAYLTRKSDSYLTLRERLAVARKYKADMFIAVHADAAYKNHDARGAAVYALSLRGATSEATRWLANQENASELMGGVDLNDKSNILKSVLLNLSQTATLHASLRVGQKVIMKLGEIGPLHHPGVEQAGFVVLKSPDIPSLLIETGFISNPAEEARLSSARYQQYLATAIMRGIKSYFLEWPPRDTTLQRYAKNDRATAAPTFL